MSLSSKNDNSQRVTTTKGTRLTGGKSVYIRLNTYIKMKGLQMKLIVDPDNVPTHSNVINQGLDLLAESLK